MATIAIGSSSHNGQSATVKTLVLSLSTVAIDIPGHVFGELSLPKMVIKESLLRDYSHCF
eukprot:2147459-Amphidinium_carterae.1